MAMMSASSFLDLMDGKADIRRFSREEYHALIAAGVLRADERLELLDGLILKMPAQSEEHAETVGRLAAHLLPRLVARAGLRVNAPFAASDNDEPEPDLLILTHGAAEPPRGALCAFEVAVSTQRRDRRKVAIYANARVPQLILVDVPKRQARVCRAPQDGDYGLIELYREGAPIVIDAFPDVTFDLAQVLPRAV